jgi:hypothetical protein
VRKFSKAHTEKLLATAMTLDNSYEIKELLDEALEEAGMTRLVRPKDAR